jgi:hypothetical protein
MHDPIIIPVAQEETKAELRSRGYSLEISPPDDEEHELVIEHHEPPPLPPDDEDHEPVIEHHEPPPPPPLPPIIDEPHEPVPIVEADDHTKLIAGILYAAFCVFIDERHIITFDW